MAKYGPLGAARVRWAGSVARCHSKNWISQNKSLGQAQKPKTKPNGTGAAEGKRAHLSGVGDSCTDQVARPGTSGSRCLQGLRMRALPFMGTAQQK